MAIPDYQEFMLPLLRAISDGQEHRLRDVAEQLIASTDLTDEERGQRLPSGKQTVVANRIGWASTYSRTMSVSPELGRSASM